MWLFRALARSWKAVSRSQQSFRPGRQRSFSLSFLGAKSLLRRECLRSCFQSKPVYGVPATAKSSTEIHFHGSCFLPWRVLNSLHQWENQLSSACFGAERDYFPKWPLSIRFHSAPSANLDINRNRERGHCSTGVTLSAQWKHSPFHLFAKAATAIYGGEGRLRLLVKRRYDKAL